MKDSIRSSNKRIHINKGQTRWRAHFRHVTDCPTDAFCQEVVNIAGDMDGKYCMNFLSIVPGKAALKINTSGDSNTIDRTLFYAAAIAMNRPLEAYTKEEIERKSTNVSGEDVLNDKDLVVDDMDVQDDTIQQLRRGRV